jgi:hypothetical protein
LSFDERGLLLFFDSGLINWRSKDDFCFGKEVANAFWWNIGVRSEHETKSKAGKLLIREAVKRRKHHFLRFAFVAVVLVSSEEVGNVIKESVGVNVKEKAEKRS